VAGPLNIGVLAFHGDVSEHLDATERAAFNLKLAVQLVPVRQKQDLAGLDGLIIPGGESTTIYKLCVREDMVAGLQRIRNIFGTCAGAIMLAKSLQNPAEGQKTLGLMDIEVDRNAYGRQSHSFQAGIDTVLGATEAVFIRAPKITRVGPAVNVLARFDNQVIACEETTSQDYYLALSFHPELTTTLFHEYFLKRVAGLTA